MIKLKFILLNLIVGVTVSYGQVPHDVNVSSNGTAERVARFRVQDEMRDFLEITNSTNHSGKFIPSIWAHQESDNRYVLRHFATTTSSKDNGTIPLMIFRAEIRDGINLNAPNGGTFPWGVTSSSVRVRPLFSWENGNSQLMNLAANGSLGIGTPNPSAKLHSVGTVRFQDLPLSRTKPTYSLGADNNGNITRFSGGSGGVQLLPCTIMGSQTNKLPKINGSGDLVCSQIFDNGRNVGIGTTSPIHKLSVNGNIHSMSNIFISDRKFKNDIKDISNPLETIMQLEGKKYYWKKNEFEQYEFDNRRQIGFIAQDVKEVIPEIVYVNDAGEHSMNYTALIPILVEAIKDQQDQINELKKRLPKEDKLILKGGTSKSSEAYISANYPNPYGSSTSIDYYIPDEFSKAELVVSDTMGLAVDLHNLKEREINSRIVLEKRNLSPGIYFYSLVLDGVIADTKKMILQ